MDRRVKERLIGASILVVLIVLVVPELLSGPKLAPAPQPMLPAAAASETNRTVNVDLSTSKSAAASEQEEEPAAQPAAAAPLPQRPETSSAAPGAGSMVANSMPVPSPPASSAQHLAAVESATASPMSSLRGAWTVQLGSFTSRANADNLTRQVKGQGFAAFVSEGRSGASARYRVRVGPLPDRESAERVAAKLKSLKHDSSLVSPPG